MSRRRASNGHDRDDGPDEAGLERYESFHQLAPKDAVLDEQGSMPRRVHCLGKAVHVLYRSGKVDPETGKKPRSPQNYIHDHDAGVKLYEPCLHSMRRCDPEEVPASVRAEDGDGGETTLVLLGQCLGLAYKAEDGADKGEEMEIEFDDPKVELYCIPSGKALVVVEDKREILFIVWGGGLGVEPRGIVG